MMKKTGKTVADSNTKSSATRLWAYTFFYKDRETAVLLRDKLEKLKCQYIMGFEKCPTTERDHIQGVVYWNSAKTFDQVKKILPDGCHIEKGYDWKALREYCKKDGEYYSRVYPPKEKEPSFQDRQIELILQKKYNNVQWKPWQRGILNLVEKEPDDRKCYWFYDEHGGSGKSYLSKYIAMKFPTIIGKGKGADVLNQILVDMENEIAPRVVIVDIPRSKEKFVDGLYGTLEDIQGGCIYSGKYEGGRAFFLTPHIIVFANFHPEVDKWSNDRYYVIDVNKPREVDEFLRDIGDC